MRIIALQNSRCNTYPICVDKKIAHLKKHFSFKEEELIEVRKMYALQYFDPTDFGVRKVYEISSSLCDEFNSLFVEVANGSKKAKKRQKKILDLLFIGHGFIPEVRRRLSAVIGLAELTSNNFVNVGATFSPYSLVILQSFVQFGADVSVGLSSPIEKDGKRRLGKLIVKAHCWLCSKAHADLEGEIGMGSVLAAGATLKESAPDNSLLLGNPASVKRHIEENEVFGGAIENIDPARVAMVMETWKKMGYSISKKTAEKILSGEVFSTLNPSLGLLYLKTHMLCEKLDSPSLSIEERETVLDLLFPSHGKNFKVGKGLFLDLAGTVSVGDDVSIEDNVTIGGRVTLEDKVTLEEGSCIFSSNHPLCYKSRRPRFSFAKGLHIDVRLEKNVVKNGVHLGKGSMLAPKASISRDVKANTLALGDGKYIEM